MLNCVGESSWSCFIVLKAATFKKTSHRVHRKMWWRSTRWTIICVLVVLLIIGILILVILFSTHVLPVTDGDSSATTTTAAPWVSFQSHHRCLLNVTFALSCCPENFSCTFLIDHCIFVMWLCVIFLNWKLCVTEEIHFMVCFCLKWLNCLADFVS